ncbi:hypothetical protein [Micromonospora coerulea]|uniref:hypothetical protein n=1 Tax=Micromonospora coerulea TaxID=47856 RepID=UPI001F28B5F3|nr:hypothetical protein [Micromonospora veneta]
MTDPATTDRVLAALLAMQRQSWEQGVTGHALLDLGLDELAMLVADAAVTRQHPDGRLGDVSGDPAAFREANTAQLLAYAALTGVADGRLAPSWLDVGADLLVAADRRVDRYGRVTGVSGAPDFERPGTSPEGQAFHLLAHAARARARAAISSARSAPGRRRPGRRAGGRPPAS